MNVGGYSSKGRGWTVHSYWVPTEHFEQNVWDDFERRFLNIVRLKEKAHKQIEAFKEGKYFEDLNKKANILILNQSALDLSNIPDGKIDYVFTDPPYGGSIQYFELSTLWASWLGFDVNFEEEITINKQQKKRFEDYHRMLHKAFVEIFKKLKYGHWMTVTFHSTSVKIFNSIIRAVVFAGFNLEKIVYQPPSTKETFNRTLNPHGTASGDYYIQFRKPEVTKQKKGEKIDRERYKRVVVGTVTRIIAKRGEPTSYQFILNGIYPELERYGYLLVADPEDIQRIIRTQKRFSLIKNKGWWFRNPEQFKIDVVPLHERVEMAILQVLHREVKVTFDEVLQEIFMNFRNALTPNPPSVKAVLEEYASKTEDGKWYLKPKVVMREREHSEMIGFLAEIGKKSGYDIWIGLREQSDVYEGKPLSELCDFEELSLSEISPDDIERYVKQIDVLWIKDRKVAFSFEVEYTTAVTDAFMRCSAIPEPHQARRLIVVPEERERFLYRKLYSELLKERVEKEDWRLIFFKDLREFNNRNKRKKMLNPNEILRIAKTPLEEREKQATIDFFA